MAQFGMVSATAIRDSAAVESNDLGGASMPEIQERGLLARTARYFALAAAGAGLGQFMAATSQKADGALIQNATDRPAAITAAQPLLAVNGGPEATAEITGTDGVSADVGVTMLDATSFVMMAHTLTAPGDTVPDLAKIKSINIIVSNQWRTNRGASTMYPVNLPSLQVAKGFDGTFNTLDLAGGKLNGTGISGLGKFTLDATPLVSGKTLANVEGGFYTTPSIDAAGNTPPADGQYMKTIANVDTGNDPLNANTTDYGATDFGFNVPSSSLGVNGKGLNGASGSPEIVDSTTLLNSDGSRTVSLQIAGVFAGQSGNAQPGGASLFATFSNPVAAEFAQDIIDDPIDTGGGSMPEPASATVIGSGVAGYLLSRRRRS